MNSQTVLIEVYDDPEEDIKWILANLTQYLAPGKKRELILRWADDLVELHKRGEYAEPLTTISSHITSHLKENNLHHALPYVHEVLPFKFKQVTNIGKDSPLLDWYEDKNEEILVRDSSESEDAKILLAQDCKKINANYISRVERTVKILSEVKKCLETNTVLEPEIPEVELEEYFVRWDSALNRTQEVLDGRQQVLPSTQHMLFYSQLEQNF